MLGSPPPSKDETQNEHSFHQFEPLAILLTADLEIERKDNDKGSKSCVID